MEDAPSQNVEDTPSKVVTTPPTDQEIDRAAMIEAQGDGQAGRMGAGMLVANEATAPAAP